METASSLGLKETWVAQAAVMPLILSPERAVTTQTPVGTALVMVFCMFTSLSAPFVDIVRLSLSASH